MSTAMSAASPTSMSTARHGSMPAENSNIRVNIRSNVHGNICSDVRGDVHSDVRVNICGDMRGNSSGKMSAVISAAMSEVMSAAMSAAMPAVVRGDVPNPHGGENVFVDPLQEKARTHEVRPHVMYHFVAFLFSSHAPRWCKVDVCTPRVYEDQLLMLVLETRWATPPERAILPPTCDAPKSKTGDHPVHPYRGGLLRSRKRIYSNAQLFSYHRYSSQNDDRFSLFSSSHLQSSGFFCLSSFSPPRDGTQESRGLQAGSSPAFPTTTVRGLLF